MLSIILKILGILGIILLVLLGILLVILLLVLCFPVCYRIKAEKKAASTDEGSGQPENATPQKFVFADLKVWWLFGLLRAGYKYPEPGVLKAKFLFFTLYDSGADTEMSSDADLRDEDFETDKTDSPKKNTVKSEINPPKTTPAPDNGRDVSRQTVTKKQDLSDVTNGLEGEEATSSQNKNLFEKIQYTIQKFCDRIKNISAKLREIKENIAYYKGIFEEEDTKELLKHAAKRLGKILKSFRPRKLRANIFFGASSPDITGYVCAIYGISSPHLGKHVIFTPDFEQEIFEGDLYAAGHTTVFKVLWNVLMIVKDKRLWELRDKLNRKPN